jgi:HK97 gp10 family phage protein
MSGSGNGPIVNSDITELVEDLAAISEKSPEEITGNIFNVLGMEIMGNARAKAPVRTGRLRDSIDYKISGNQLIIGPHVPYAPYMEFGTGSRGEFGGSEYIIRPRTKPYLKFKINGKWISTKEVHHPGISPRPFMRPAVEEAMGDLADKLAERGALMITKGPNHVGA